ncbi:hypothetical protein BDA99DRAFT_527671 [Phascolomyces articulosus]|uniref:Uncharacterized protein n=1 Tax=Phascolomyces articulosus TaxID=60185 RepID=A0AAD5P9A2_9FUNG|nr:hypothetical protein BDA99DRAFT_527671 [Phascolomyces articulosus]
MERITFSVIDNPPVDARYGNLTTATLPSNTTTNTVGRTINMRNSPLLIENYASLTYLQFAFQSYDGGMDDCTCMTIQLCSILRRCPHLVHLFLESGGAVRHGECIDQVLFYCPRLETLVLSPNAEMPPSILDQRMNHNDINDNYDNVAHIEKRKLKNLVMVGGDIKLTPQHLIKMYQKYHTTLELLYLQYNGEWSEPISLSELARLGTPRLREFRLKSDIQRSSYNEIEPSLQRWKKAHRPIQQALENFFSSSSDCKNLQVIQLTNKYPIRARAEADCHIHVDDPVLEAIAKNCSRLRYMDLTGVCDYSYPDGLVQFATILGTQQQQLQLGYLKLYVGDSTDVALEMVQQLSTLKEFHIVPRYPFQRHTLADRFELSSVPLLMRDRGGTLTVGGIIPHTH